MTDSEVRKAMAQIAAMSTGELVELFNQAKQSLTETN